MIKTKDIHKSFGALEVLKGIDLSIDKGEVVSIVGPSGAGKTTLLQILGTLSRPTSGEIEIDGVAVHTLSDKNISKFRNTKIGFVFQFHHLLPEFSAFENVCIPGYIAGRERHEVEKHDPQNRCITDPVSDPSPKPFRSIFLWHPSLPDRAS